MEPEPYLAAYYNRGLEDGRLASQHGSVEFLTTMRYIERYAKPGDRILEIGAGTGRYAHALARQGYTLDALELIPYNIEVFRQNTLTNEQISIAQGNALDLSRFADSRYDITLLLGPMYHLYTEADKIQALGEAVRVTKKGGRVLVSYCLNEGTVIMHCSSGATCAAASSWICSRRTTTASRTRRKCSSWSGRRTSTG